MRRVLMLPVGLVLAIIVGCAPAAPPSPTAAPKPAATTAPAPPPKPAATAAPAPKAPAAPTARPAAPPTTQPAAKPKPAFDEQAVANFYRGKTMRMIIGFSPGGGFDIVARIAAAAVGQHIPGNPNVIAVNQPGAGSLLTANSVYSAEPQDGTVIGMTSERTIASQLIGDPAVKFDARKVQWLGSISSSPVTCIVRKDRGFKSIRDLVNGPEVPMGATGGASTQAPLLLNQILGTKFKVVSGYPGVAQVKIAIESGEVDGLCISWDGQRSLAPEWYQEPSYATALSTMGPAAPPDEPFLKGVPRVEELVKGDFERKLVEAYSKPDEAAMPFQFGPDVPADRVAAVRAAFARAFADKEVLGKIEKAGRKPVARSGEQVAAIYAAALAAPPEVAAELKKFFAAAGG